MSLRMRAYLLRMNALDTKLCIAFNHASNHLLVRDFFRIVSRLGDGAFWYTLMVLLLLTHGFDALLPVMHMALAGLAGTAVYKWLKGKTLRPRPFEVQQAVQMNGKVLDQFSFPSGHTLHAVVFTIVALHYFPALIALILPFTILVAMSRVVLGLHYPSDVLAGTVIGWLIANLSFTIVDYLKAMI